MSERFARQVALFGTAGQEKLRQTDVAVVGLSGLGSPLIQQLALLGVPRLRVFDPEEVDETNRNRLVGARYGDPIPGTRKVDVAERLAKEIDPSIEVKKHRGSVVSKEGFALLRGATHIFGCLDSDGPRLFLAQVSAMLDRPYIDLASDTESSPTAVRYGGRVFTDWRGGGCLICCEVVDPVAARDELTSPAARADRNAIYGVGKSELGATGPSVAPLNAVVASLAAMEFMVGATGLREPRRHLEYRGNTGKVSEQMHYPEAGCVVCGGRGTLDEGLLRCYFVK